jgi:hypothetical protein
LTGFEGGELVRDPRPGQGATDPGSALHLGGRTRSLTCASIRCGRTPMPGLIDAHIHLLTLVKPIVPGSIPSDQGLR